MGTVFEDEPKLDVNYLPPELPHREAQLRSLSNFYSFLTESPSDMSRNVLIIGSVGSGKTVLSQRFGLNVTNEAKRYGTNLRYVHINCQECRGNLFLVLWRVMRIFHPNFPRRGYSAEELLDMLLEVLDNTDTYVVLTLDELEALIRREGTHPIYNLTRAQEQRGDAPRRFSIIGIMREEKWLERLEESARSTLQRNLIYLPKYEAGELVDIVRYRANLALRENAVLDEVIEMIADLASESGDARYALDLLWRAGKYADEALSPTILPEHVRRAAVLVYPMVRFGDIEHLPRHTKYLLLAISRALRQTQAVYLSMGEAKRSYAVVCEEYGEKPCGHTQLWSYVRELAMTGIVGIKKSGEGRRGRTTLISLPRIPAEHLEGELVARLR